MNLVTLQQARDHLRSDETADDADLSLKIAAASAAVLGYVTVSRWEPERDEDGVPVLDDEGKEVPALVDGAKVVRILMQQATLMTVGYLYRERDGGHEHAVPTQHGYGYALPMGATALLFSLRHPSLA